MALAEAPMGHGLTLDPMKPYLPIIGHGGWLVQPDHPA